MKAWRRFSLFEFLKPFLGLLLCFVISQAPDVMVQLYAQTGPVQVKLNPTTSPTAAEPGVTLVNVIGGGFPSGTITASATHVTLAPVGSTPSMSAQTVSVTTVIGSTKRVTFQVVRGTNLNAPAQYLVSVSGTDSLGTSFTSNTSTLTIDPPASITLNPTAALTGHTLAVSITGKYSSFLQGSTVANFGPGISVGGAPSGSNGPVTVVSATSATAQISIGSLATPGARDVTVTSGAEVAQLKSGFTVVGTPALTSVTPNSGQQGQQNLPVNLTGQFTHWVQGTSTVSFGPNITVAGLTVNSATTATATLNIDPTAATVARNVTVTTGSEVVTLNNGFTVTAGMPVLVSASPNSAQQGQQNLPVTLTGQFTHFSSSSVVTFSGTGITAGAPTTSTATSVTVSISVATNAATGPRNVTVTTGSELVTLTNGFSVTAPAGKPAILSVSPGVATQGQSIQVTVTGQNTNWVQGSTEMNFGPGVGVGNGLMGSYGPVTVTSPTTATASLTIATNATPGSRAVAAQTGSELASLNGGFAVNGLPFLSSLSPASSQKGQSVTVTIQGVFTNFKQGTTQANFGAGISVGGAAEGAPGPVTVTSPTTATAQLTVDSAAATGLRNPVVQTNSETASLNGSGFLVLGPISGPPPVVTFTSPSEGSQVAAPTAITGTVTSPNLADWILEYEASGSTVFTQFAQGTTSAVTGTLDPTLLLNGIAQVRLTGTDQSGQTTSTILHVVITRDAKVGNFTLTFTDLTVPVAGLPIQISRTYDSRLKSSGDFGFGWSLDFNTTKVDTNGILGNNWLGTSSGGFLPNYCVQPDPNNPNVVSVRLPGGNVYQFQATIANGACQQLVPPEFVDMGFTPVGNTPAGAQLSSPDATGLFVSGGFPGSLQLIDLNTGTSFDPDQFLLTTPDGRKLQVSRTFGLQQITDTNGNTLTFSSSGITASNGRSVSFTRDGSNRITKITDPNGNTLQYAYDSNGDLVSFTDQVGNISTFTYDGAHDLVAFKDPRGIQPVRNVYDDSGRLIQEIDAFGNVLNFTHDIAARTETLTDFLGNPTTKVYDPQGNVISTTDALGHVTTGTYDSKGNRVSETDALGHTTSFTYDANNHPLTITDPLGNVITMTYSSLGKALTLKDALGHTVTNTYDSNGNVLTSTDPLGNVTTNTYNSAGLLTSTKDPLGNVTSYTYDSAGDLLTQTDAAGTVTAYTYDANGNRLSQSVTRTTKSGPQTLVTTYQYDAANRQIKTTLPDGSTRQTSYNSIGAKLSSTDELGRVTNYAYDASGRLLTTTYPDGTQQTIAYDADGHKIQVVAPSGVTTQFEYDAIGRQISTTNVNTGGSTQTAYDAVGHVLSVTDPLGHVTQYAYDNDGRRTQTTDPAGGITNYTFDNAGNTVSVKDANNHTTSYTYDADDRNTRITYPDSTFDSTTYDADGRTIAITDAAGKTTQYGYDSLGRLVSVTDALSQVTKYAYDEVGDRVSQTDANNHITQYQYDSRGRRTVRTLPAGQSENYAYDAAGNLTSRLDFNGKTTAYSYDSLNRLLTKVPDASFAAPTVSFTYTASGKRSTMVDATGTTSYQYDSADRLIQVTRPAGTLSYSYDEAGNLLTLTGGGITVDYTYDSLNRLASVSEPSTGVTQYAYDGVGNLASVTYPNGVVHSYSYDTKNRLTNLGANKGATPLTQYTYTLDASGHRLSVSELSGRNVHYTYDNIYRLTSETIGSDLAGENGAIGYTYDAVGNRLQRTSTVPAIPAGLSNYDTNDRLTTDTYDANGNTLLSGGVSRTYDFENRLIEQGSNIQIVYDGDGNRISKTVGGVTTTYLVDTANPTGYAQVVSESSSSGETRTYVYGLELISQHLVSISPALNLTSFYLYDGHGSVRALTNSAGTVTDTYEYDAFGNLLASTGTTPNHYLFAGEQFDEDLNLYYNRARYLNTKTGRFLTMDTYEGDPESPISLHKYLYAGLDPVNQNDPSGNQLGDIALSISIQVQLFVMAHPILTGIITLVLLALAPDDFVNSLPPTFGSEASLLQTVEAEATELSTVRRLYDEATGVARMQAGKNFERWMVETVLKNLAPQAEQLAIKDGAVVTGRIPKGAAVIDAIYDFVITEFKTSFGAVKKGQLQQFAKYAEATGMSINYTFLTEPSAQEIETMRQWIAEVAQGVEFSVSYVVGK